MNSNRLCSHDPSHHSFGVRFPLDLLGFPLVDLDFSEGAGLAGAGFAFGLRPPEVSL